MANITADSLKEFYHLQAQLKKAGYSLEDYNEYTSRETWTNGPKKVTLAINFDIDE